MKTLMCSIFGVAILFSQTAVTVAQPKERVLQIKLTVPSTAYKVKIQEVYQTNKELWVLSKVSSGGVGLTVISKVKDQVKVAAPNLAVKHFILNKKWNWTGEKQYTYLKSRKQFDKLVKEQNAKRIYKRKGPKKGAKGKRRNARYIVMYRKDIFIGGRTKNGLNLQQLAEKHAKQFNGKVGRLLRIINGYTIELTPENARKLGALPEVRNVELDRPVGIGRPLKR